MAFEKLTEDSSKRMHEKIKSYLKDNSFESIIDTENEEYRRNPIVLDKFMSHSGMIYCEFDQRLRLD